ncbi:uncharacterized protein DUF2399 [Pseudonocardia hierapolitana]|uniref:Uncharacterized protein DUF2399 n=1 Tax=Pseudonocardia hierapolitana TaxID=1128676 RepID=A0A561SLA8_9PSEU|nr:DUF2399 domain-containing protein [Pseudonocardia hierapolitana]TWF75664.1 uncharacterized protein DUF2399 [Pseudonocardia hierapolitana]
MALARGGRKERYDWGGCAIGNVMFGRLPVAPRRFDAAAYRRSALHGAGRPLTGEPVVCSWDPELAEAMRVMGHGVEDEHVLAEFLADLHAG